ncbi:serine hydrolase domain-containing protein [Nocardia yunnanensis]|uniref:serine hydrolase domain-containing protein n=1 Tax=Nocardia yunnanensis TaxID=2382165 RepID=UPI0024822B05|nr:serine hydrolase domain-containing protein [Nocardia yunnanensis]
MLAGVVALAVSMPACGVAAPARDSVSQQLRRDSEAIHALGVSGVQARVVTGEGRQVLAVAGSADRRSGAAVSAQGYFRMASTAKTLIAIVVLQLAAEGRLSLDDTLAGALPAVVAGSPIDAEHITVRQLLQHTSGIHDDLPGYTTAEEYLAQRHELHSGGS